MNKAILTLLAIGFLAVSQCHASRPNTYEVDSRGSVSIGASKLGSKDFDVECKRKPERHEITDIVPPSMTRSVNSFFSW